MKLIGELEGKVLIYEFNKERYALVDVRRKLVMAVRNWYSQIRFMEVENFNDTSEYDDEAIEILKNSDIVEQFAKLDEEDAHEKERRGEKWAEEMKKHRQEIEKAQNEMIEEYHNK